MPGLLKCWCKWYYPRYSKRQADHYRFPSTRHSCGHLGSIVTGGLCVGFSRTASQNIPSGKASGSSHWESHRLPTSWSTQVKNVHALLLQSCLKIQDLLKLFLKGRIINILSLRAMCSLCPVTYSSLFEFLNNFKIFKEVLVSYQTQIDLGQGSYIVC